MKNIKVRNSLLWNETFSEIDDIQIHSNFCFSFDRWSPQPIDGFQLHNCTLITNILNANLSIDMTEPFFDRSVLINANQAEFFVEVKQKYTMTFVSIIIYFVGVDRGVFETQQIGKLITKRSSEDTSYIHVSLKRNSMQLKVSVVIQMFFFIIVDCLPNTHLTCQHRLHILPYTTAALIKIRFSSIGATVDRITYSIRRQNSNGE
jgi:hypothetical protein